MNIKEMIEQLQGVDQAAKGLRESPVKASLRIHLQAALDQLSNQARWEAENPEPPEGAEVGGQ